LNGEKDQMRKGRHPDISESLKHWSDQQSTNIGEAEMAKKKEASPTGLLDREQLKKGANELNALGFEPEIKIDVELPELQAQVTKAASLLNKDDEISKGLADTLKALGIQTEAKVKGTETPAAAPASPETPAAAPAAETPKTEPTRKPKTPAEPKEKKTPKPPAPPAYKRGQSIGAVIAKNADSTVSVATAVKEAAELYAQKTGKTVNEKESGTVFDIVTFALVEMGIVTVDGDNIKVRKF
jgi:hypothetical protein